MGLGLGIPLFVVSLLLLIRNLYLAQKLRDVREGHHDEHPAASGAGPTRAAPDEAEQKV